MGGGPQKSKSEEERDAVLEILERPSSDLPLHLLCSFFHKIRVHTLQSSDHIDLQRILSKLQEFSQALQNQDFIEALARAYDNLLTGDYAKTVVLATILQLLFLVEDISEHAQGKSICGKVFIERLITLVCARVRSLRLERAAAETLCALITRSPENQELFVGNAGACANLFRTSLTTCGDFHLQATISEVLYRLSRKHTVLLGYVGDAGARRAMTSISQMKKPHVINEIRKFVILVNASMGSLRRVHSFKAEKIVINGREEQPQDQNWVHVGVDHISFYASLPKNGNTGATTVATQGSTAGEAELLDIYFSDIKEFNRQPAFLEIGFFKSDEKEVVKYKVDLYLSSNDASALYAVVAPKLPTLLNPVAKPRTKSSIGIFVPARKEYHTPVVDTQPVPPEEPELQPNGDAEQHHAPQEDAPREVPSISKEAVPSADGTNENMVSKGNDGSGNSAEVENTNVEASDHEHPQVLLENRNNGQLPNDEPIVPLSPQVQRNQDAGNTNCDLQSKPKEFEHGLPATPDSEKLDFRQGNNVPECTPDVNELRNKLRGVFSKKKRQEPEKMPVSEKSEPASSFLSSDQRLRSAVTPAPSTGGKTVVEEKQPSRSINLRKGSRDDLTPTPSSGKTVAVEKKQVSSSSLSLDQLCDDLTPTPTSKAPARVDVAYFEFPLIAEPDEVAQPPTAAREPEKTNAAEHTFLDQGAGKEPLRRFTRSRTRAQSAGTERVDERATGSKLSKEKDEQQQQQNGAGASSGAGRTKVRKTKDAQRELKTPRSREPQKDRVIEIKHGPNIPDPSPNVNELRNKLKGVFASLEREKGQAKKHAEISGSKRGEAGNGETSPSSGERAVAEPVLLEQTLASGKRPEPESSSAPGRRANPRRAEAEPSPTHPGGRWAEAEPSPTHPGLSSGRWAEAEPSPRSEKRVEVEAGKRAGVTPGPSFGRLAEAEPTLGSGKRVEAEPSPSSGKRAEVTPGPSSGKRAIADKLRETLRSRENETSDDDTVAQGNDREQPPLKDDDYHGPHEDSDDGELQRALVTVSRRESRKKAAAAACIMENADPGPSKRRDARKTLAARTADSDSGSDSDDHLRKALTGTSRSRKRSSPKLPVAGEKSDDDRLYTDLRSAPKTKKRRTSAPGKAQFFPVKQEAVPEDVLEPTCRSPVMIDDSDDDHLRFQLRTISRSEKRRRCAPPIGQHWNVKAEGGEPDFQASDDECLLMLLASLLKKFDLKVKKLLQIKTEAILSSAADKIKSEAKAADSQIRADIEKFAQQSEQTFGSVEERIKDEGSKFRRKYEEFCEEFKKHAHFLDDLMLESDGNEAALVAIADKQKLSHRKLISQTQKVMEEHLVEAERKIQAMRKVATRQTQSVRQILQQFMEE